MPDAQQQQPPKKRGARGAGKLNPRRCSPEHVARAKSWADWYTTNRLMRGIPPAGISPDELRETE